MKTWRPSLGAIVWVLFFLGLSWSDWRLVMINADGDPALHWRIGNWMLERRQVIRAEQFSHTRLGAPLISKEWLSEIIYATAGNRLGWQGFVLLAAALVATTLWLLYRQLRAQGVAALVATGLVMVAALACSHHWLARPHLVTHLLTVGFVWLLRAGRYRWLPVLMVAWVNLHGAFFTGFVLLGCYVVGSLWGWEWRRAAVLGGWLAVVVVVSLLNPNTWRLHAQIVEFLRTPLLAGLANEFASPNFHSAGMRGFVVVLLLLGVMLLWVRPRLTPVEVTLLAVWGVLALRQVRHVPVFTLVAVPILAAHWQTWLAGRDWPRYRAWVAKLEQMDSGAAGGWAVAVAVALAIGWAPRADTHIMPERFPVTAVEFLRAHPAAVSGEMFNDYGWGGYLMLALPERRVFVDGRNDFYGAALIEEFRRVDAVAPGWEEVLAKYKVGWTILPVNHPLNQLLAERPDWPVVYADAVAVVRVRVTEPHRGQSGTS